MKTSYWFTALLADETGGHGLRRAPRRKEAAGYTQGSRHLVWWIAPLHCRAPHVAQAAQRLYAVWVTDVVERACGPTPRQPRVGCMVARLSKVDGAPAGRGGWHLPLSRGTPRRRHSLVLFAGGLTPRTRPVAGKFGGRGGRLFGRRLVCRPGWWPHLMRRAWLLAGGGRFGVAPTTQSGRRTRPWGTPRSHAALSSSWQSTLGASLRSPLGAARGRTASLVLLTEHLRLSVPLCAWPATLGENFSHACVHTHIRAFLRAYVLGGVRSVRMYGARTYRACDASEAHVRPLLALDSSKVAAGKHWMRASDSQAVVGTPQCTVESFA